MRVRGWGWISAAIGGGAPGERPTAPGDWAEETVQVRAQDRAEMQSGPLEAGDHSPDACPGNVSAPASGTNTGATPAASRRHLGEQGAGSRGGAGAGPVAGRSPHFRRMGTSGQCACVTSAATSVPCPVIPPPYTPSVNSRSLAALGRMRSVPEGPSLPSPPLKICEGAYLEPLLLQTPENGAGKSCVIPAGKGPGRRTEAKLVEERLASRL